MFSTVSVADSDWPRRHTCGIGDARKGREHPTSKDPPSYEAEYQQEGQRNACGRREGTQQVRAVGHESPSGADRTVRYIAEQEDPHDNEQQDAGNYQEPGVAQCESESNAQA